MGKRFMDALVTVQARTTSLNGQKRVCQNLYDLYMKTMRAGHEVSPEVEAEARKCNMRHYKRFRHLISKGKKINVAKVAVASEMVRDMWAIGLMVYNENLLT